MSSNIKAADFYSNHPPERIMSSECEFTIQTVDGRSIEEYISRAAIKKAGYKSVTTIGHGRSNLSEFLDMGGKLYVDLSHPEVAMGENLGPIAAGAADLGAIEVLRRVVQASGKPHRGIHRNSGINTEKNQTTTGYHPNFLIPRGITKPLSDKFEIFKFITASHLTSQTWSWSGTVNKKGFRLSQKVESMGDPPITDLAGRKTEPHQKPMAMVPSYGSDTDTIGSNGSWARFEVRFADPGFSPTVSYLKFASTSLVLRLSEHQRLIDKERLIGKSFRWWAATAKQFSGDLSFKYAARTQDGTTISAIGYQDLLIEESLKLAEKIELPESEIAAIGLWQFVCDQMRLSNIEKGEYANLENCTDFAPRHNYLNTYFKKEDLSSKNPEVVEANLDWDRVLPTGVGMLYWQKVPSPYISWKQVEETVTQPAPTRASLRSQKIKQAEKYAKTRWSRFQSPIEIFEMNDPYATE